MKKLKLIQFLSVIFIFTGTLIYSQTDSVLTYYPDEVSIDYSNVSMKIISPETGKVVLDPILIPVKGIHKIRFLSDSLISISGDQKSDQQLIINKISGISIKSGTYMGLGITLGAIAGLAVGIITGAVIGSAYDTETNSGSGVFNFNSLGKSYGMLIGSSIGILTGAVIGGIIGSNSPSYKTYVMKKFKLDKRKELERILKIEKKINRGS